VNGANTLNAHSKAWAVAAFEPERSKGRSVVGICSSVAVITFARPAEIEIALPLHRQAPFFALLEVP
jgi:hypothetical protein